MNTIDFSNFFKENSILKKIKATIFSFSLTEKIIFWLFFLVFVGSIFGILISINQKYITEIPVSGGKLTEGVIGTPRFINPLIALSDTDKDLASLIYSGLVKETVTGDFITDLADNFEVSEDKLEYTFNIKESAEFHDGEPVTSDDVIFTIIKAQDPIVRSIQRSKWDGVVVEKVNDKKVIFRLESPRNNFLENVTLGILPSHLWKEISSNEFSLSRYNTEPIGSGPYEIKSIKRDTIDIPQSYNLVSFKDYSLGRPFIKEIVFKFSKNQDELVEMYENKEINSVNSVSPEIVSELENRNAFTIKLPLPRIFGVFFNQNESPVLANKEVRQALNAAVPKQTIIDEVLFGFGDVVDGPIPEHLVTFEKLSQTENVEGPNKIIEAKGILEDAGWKKNSDGIYIKETDDSMEILSFSISTSKVPELIKVAEEVIKSWQELGAIVELQIFEVADLNQNVIRPRNFESLLFGMVINEESDFYSFWHSSQRNDPGLNITSYVNITTDEILENLLSENDSETRKELFINFEKEIQNDIPAVFLYSPQFIYIVPEKVKGLEIRDILSSSGRFINVHEWFIDTDKVWKIFTNNNLINN